MIRRGSRQDVRFLKDMLRHAFYWRSAGTVEDSSLWRYVAGWGRRGDAAVVALEGGFPVGAAWYRLFGRDEPGFGFVEEEIPERAQRPPQDDALLVRDLDRAVAQLPEEQRAVLLLVTLENMSYEDVARTLDIPIGTVMSRLSRAREKLRTTLLGQSKLKVVK